MYLTDNAITVLSQRLYHGHMKPCNDLLKYDLVQVDSFAPSSHLLFYYTEGDLRFIPMCHHAVVLGLAEKCVALNSQKIVKH